MELEEAITVVRSLAEGVDPGTKELCAEDSICRNPHVVKALNRALAALVAQQDRERNRPSSAGKYWTRAEVEQVCEELRKGVDFQQIAKTHNRSVGSIVARLIKLGKISAGSSGQLFPADLPRNNKRQPSAATDSNSTTQQAG